MGAKLFSCCIPNLDEQKEDIEFSSLPIRGKENQETLISYSNNFNTNYTSENNTDLKDGGKLKLNRNKKRKYNLPIINQKKYVDFSEDMQVKGIKSSKKKTKNILIKIFSQEHIVVDQSVMKKTINNKINKHFRKKQLELFRLESKSL